MVSIPLEGLRTASAQPVSPPEHGAEDDLRRYLRSVGRVPLLTRQDEVRLARRIEGNDTVAKTSLAKQTCVSSYRSQSATPAVG